MKTSKKTNGYFKNLNDQIKTLSYCVNHTDFNQFLKDCKLNKIGGNDTKLTEYLEKSVRYTFLEFCVNQEKFYLRPGKNGTILNDKTQYSMLKLSNLLKTLIQLEDKEETIQVRTGSHEEIKDGVTIEVPTYENRTQIGFETLTELFKISQAVKAA